MAMYIKVLPSQIVVQPVSIYECFEKGPPESKYTVLSTVMSRIQIWRLKP
jgi:hypothetical protein